MGLRPTWSRVQAPERLVLLFGHWKWLAVARPGRRSTSRTGLSPVMAAEQFLPPGKLETVPFVDTTFGSTRLRPTRSKHGKSAPFRRRGGSPMSLFLSLSLSLSLFHSLP